MRTRHLPLRAVWATNCLAHMAADAEAICAGMSWDELQKGGRFHGKETAEAKKNELLDKSIKEWQELTKEDNKILIKPVVVTLPPPPKET